MENSVVLGEHVSYTARSISFGSERDCRTDHSLHFGSRCATENISSQNFEDSHETTHYLISCFNFLNENAEYRKVLTEFCSPLHYRILYKGSFIRTIGIPDTLFAAPSRHNKYEIKKYAESSRK